MQRKTNKATLHVAAPRSDSLAASKELHRLKQLLRNGPRQSVKLIRLYGFGLGMLIFCMNMVWSISNKLPPVPPESAPVDAFSEVNALVHLKALTEHFGPRVIGTATLGKAGAFLVRVLQNMEKDVALASPSSYVSGQRPRMEISVQNASGAFILRKYLNGGDLVNVYDDVVNIAVRISTSGQSRNNAVLVSCHYDSALESPGASDDGIPVVAMLEIIRTLLINEPLDHAIIFLFNGGEEYWLQGSHGFITKHEWANSIRAFVNLESMGPGGRELLFQVGPKDQWLADMYAASVPRPYAFVSAQDVFQTNIIPSDTDFRIYRDYGNLTGYDLVFPWDGYWYHTAEDTMDKVPAGSIQNMGVNTLSLVRHLANASNGLHLPNRNAHYPASQSVFFDIVGRFTITVPRPTAALAVLLIILISFHMH